MLIKRIHKRRDYLDISKNARKIKTKNFIVQYRKANNNIKHLMENTINIGIVVSKVVGNAVKRNYVKRKLKIISKLAAKEITSNYDLVIVGKKNTIEENFKSLNDEIRNVFKKINCNKDE